MKPDIWHDPLFLSALKKGGGQGGSASGPIVTFNAPKAAPLRSLRINIDPVQDLHGYDSPWPAGGGKNVWPEYSTQTLHDVTITNDHGKVTINGTASEDAYFDLTVSLSVSQGTQWFLYAFNPSASSSNRLTLFVITTTGNPQVNLNNANASTTSSASADLTISKFRVRVPSGVQYTNFVLYPYFQIGGTAPTAWSPYSNICPITGWTGANVWRTGKNLFDLSQMGEREGVTVVDNTFTGHARSFTANGSVAPLYLPYGTTLTIKCIAKSDGVATSGAGFAILFKYQDGTTVRPWYTNNSETTATQHIGTITATQQIVGWRFVDYNNGTENTWTVSDFQIELGSTATSYEPYTGTTYPITIPAPPGTVYGGYIHVAEDGSAELVVTHKVITFDGTEAWSISVNGTGKRSRVYTNNAVPDAAYPCFDGLLSNIAQANVLNQGYPEVWKCLINESGKLVIGVGSSITNADDWEALLDETNMTLVYPLATPLHYPLSDITVQTLVGQNVMWADCGDVAVEWAGCNGFSKDAMLAWVMHR